MAQRDPCSDDTCWTYEAAATGAWTDEDNIECAAALLEDTFDLTSTSCDSRNYQTEPYWVKRLITFDEAIDTDTLRNPPTDYGWSFKIYTGQGDEPSDSDTPASVEWQSITDTTAILYVEWPNPADPARDDPDCDGVRGTYTATGDNQITNAAGTSRLIDQDGTQMGLCFCQ